MLRRFLIICFIIFGNIAGVVYAAETDWVGHIKVSVPYPGTADGTAWNHLIAGIQEGATDGFESTWDILPMIETNDPIQSMFIHGTVPEDKDNNGMIDKWTCNKPEEGYNSDQCSLWRDIREFDGEKRWLFIVLSPLNGATITLSWSFDVKPENMDISLLDLSNPGSSIDMKNTTSFFYTNNFETGKKYGIRYFEVKMKVKALYIFPPALPDATLGIMYSEKLTAIGGLPVWSLEKGELPPGMYIEPYTGEVRGTPLSTGSFTFTIRCEDPVSGYISFREYTININSIPKIDPLPLPDGFAGSEYMGEISVTGGTQPIKWGIRGNLPEGLVIDNLTGVISGTLRVPGIYNFTANIEDANGAMDSKPLRITVIEPTDEMSPEVIYDLQGIYITGTSLLLKWSAPADDSMTGTAALYDLRYMENCANGGDLEWDRSVELIGEPRPQVETLHTYTLTGLKADVRYCIAIKSIDAKGHISGVSNILLWPLSDTSITGLTEYATSLFLRKGYNLISFPLIPVPNIRDPLFVPFLGTYTALFRWYSAYPGITLPQYYLEETIMPGFGYFLYSPVDNINLIIRGLKIEEPEYSVMLQAGWNMFGSPYDEPIQLDYIHVKNSATDEVKPFNDAVVAGWIGNSIYWLESGNYDFASFNDKLPAVVEPWAGYWIYVNKENGIEIIFKRP